LSGTSPAVLISGAGPGWSQSSGLLNKTGSGSDRPLAWAGGFPPRLRAKKSRETRNDTRGRPITSRHTTGFKEEGSNQVGAVPLINRAQGSDGGNARSGKGNIVEAGEELADLSFLGEGRIPSVSCWLRNGRSERRRLGRGWGALHTATHLAARTMRAGDFFGVPTLLRPTK